MSRPGSQLSPAERQNVVEAALLAEAGDRFLSGPGDSWGLAVLAPPPTNLYRVPHLGIVSERTVLAEFSVADRVAHPAGDYTSTEPPTPVMNTTKPGALKNINGASKVPKRASRGPTAKKKQEGVAIRKEEGTESAKRKPGRPPLSTSQQTPDLRKIFKAKVEFKPLRIPREILLDRSSTGSTPPTPAQPLPFQIARTLHQRGYPKVFISRVTIFAH